MYAYTKYAHTHVHIHIHRLIINVQYRAYMYVCIIIYTHTCTHTHDAVHLFADIYLDLEDRESIDPGHEPGQGRLTSSTHTNQQQMTLEGKK